MEKKDNQRHAAKRGRPVKEKTIEDPIEPKAPEEEQEPYDPDFEEFDNLLGNKKRRGAVRGRRVSALEKDDDRLDEELEDLDEEFKPGEDDDLLLLAQEEED